MVHEMSAHFALVHRLLNPYMYSSSNYNTDIVDVSLTHCKAQAHYNNHFVHVGVLSHLMSHLVYV